MSRVDIPQWIPVHGMAGDEELPCTGDRVVISPYDGDEVAVVQEIQLELKVLQEMVGLHQVVQMELVVH